MKRPPNGWRPRCGRRAPRACVVRADVADEAEVLAMFEAVDHGLGRLTALVNNAGIVDVKARLDEMSAARWRRMFDVNVIGTLSVLARGGRRMSTRHGGAGGAIVNLSSVGCRARRAGHVRRLRRQQGRDRHLHARPGREVAAKACASTRCARASSTPRSTLAAAMPDRAHKLSSVIPMQRPGTAQEIAQAIAWLASDDASYVTGAVLGVSGGR